jgi:hypothetical protein
VALDEIQRVTAPLALTGRPGAKESPAAGRGLRGLRNNMDVSQLLSWRNPMRQPAATSPLHTLIAAVPVEALRSLVLELLLDGAAETSAPSQKRDGHHAAAPFDQRSGRSGRRRGWPKGKPRGGPGLPPRARAAAAIAAHPEKTNRAIADEIGVSVQTVMRARAGFAAKAPGRPGRSPKKVAAKVDPKLAARRQREAARLRAKRAAAREAKVGNGAEKAAEVTPAQALWQHAETLAPKTPWRAVAREFGTNEAQALNCYRAGTLPPGMTPAAIERFLELH